MNIDLTIVFKDQLITIGSDRAITSDYLISLLKKRKVLQLNNSYFFLDFYTGASVDLIKESAKLMLLPDFQFKQPKKEKKLPIEYLIQKVTQARKPLVIDKEEYDDDCLCSSSYNNQIDESDDRIEILIDRDQFNNIIQRFNELGIEPESNDSIGTQESSIENTETNIQNSEYNEDILQDSITNYLYNAMKTNEQFVSIT